MCNSTKGIVTNPAFRKWKDAGRKTEFLPYPLIAARSKTQMFKKKKNRSNTLEQTIFKKIIL